MSPSKDRVLQLMCPGDCTPEWQESYKAASIDQIGCTFLRDPSTMKWMDGTGLQILWAHGPSGSGKTFIGSKLVDYINLQEKCRENHQATAIYFLDPQEPQSSVDGVKRSICSLTRQLAAQLPESSTMILDQVQEATEFCPLTDGCKYSGKIFHDILSTFDHSFLVLDGIDAPKKVVQTVLDFLSGGVSQERNVHILFTSRNPPPDIQASYDVLFVQVRATKEDLQYYILHEAGMDESEIQRSGNENEFQTALTDILRLTDVCFPPLPLHSSMDPAALLVALSNAYEIASQVPADYQMTALCEFTMLQIRKVYGMLAYRVLYLAAKLQNLRYPQTAAIITDMLQALGVTRPNGTYYTVSDTIDSCRGLVIVSHKYLEMGIKSGVLNNYLLDMTSQGSINGDLVQASLKYLCGEEFRAGPCKTAAGLEQRFKKHPFFHCAARIVSVYTPTVSDAENIIDQFLQLASDSKAFGSYMQAAGARPYRDKTSYAELEADEPRWRYVRLGHTALHLAVRFVWGRKLIEGILRRGVDVDARSTAGHTALHFAIEIEDQSETVQALLENGADVSIADDGGETPLSRAVIVGSLETVKLLVQYGARVQDLCDDILFECSVWQPDIGKYLTELGVRMPEIPME